MAVVRQVKSKIKITPRVKLAQPKRLDAQPSEDERASENFEQVRFKKVCSFCESKKEPAYFDAAALRRFLNDRGKISPRSRTGNCAKHQRRISSEIKRARFLALLPFTVQL